jgi:Ca-activated chloride channel family protein
MMLAALVTACANQKEEDEVMVTGSRATSPEHRAENARMAKLAEAPTRYTACCVPTYTQPTNTERYQHLEDNPVRLAAEHPVSTFSIDVDTGAYANVRRFLNMGQLPPQDAVRVEEMINYFDYQYEPPASRDVPFRVSTELAQAPWNPEAWLLRIGIKGYDVPAQERPAANLVFLIDVSGSMQSPDKLPLLKNAFRLLTDQLTARDRVSMVVYAGSSGVVLEPTQGDQKYKIREAINQLEAGGSTNGGEGIERAYELAHATFIKDGINRVVLATDGDFNVGVVNFESLVDIAERERASGVALTTLGFGTGNYNDQLLERLADAGNGNYSYVDTLSEARKVLVSELSSTLFTIAKDVKIQVEFNPAEVLEYRLVGYENRMLAREDFNNDKVDAGDIGAGHRVTALYEIIPVGAAGRVDPLRYGRNEEAGARSGEVAYLKLRYKLPDSDTSKLIETPIGKGTLVAREKWSTDLRFAASVAAFGQLLRGGKYTGEFGYDEIEKLAKGALGEDNEGYRREFVSLVKLAASLGPQTNESARVSSARVP